MRYIVYRNSVGLFKLLRQALPLAALAGAIVLAGCKPSVIVTIVEAEKAKAESDTISSTPVVPAISGGNATVTQQSEDEYSVSAPENEIDTISLTGGSAPYDLQSSGCTGTAGIGIGSIVNDSFTFSVWGTGTCTVLIDDFHAQIITIIITPVATSPSPSPSTSASASPSPSTSPSASPSASPSESPSPSPSPSFSPGFSGRPTVDCGATGSIANRISDCQSKNGAKSAYIGTNGDGDWTLITRATDGSSRNFEVWRDETTGLIWSDTTISTYKWFAAAGYSSSTSTTAYTYYEGMAGGANQPANPISICNSPASLNAGGGTNGLTNYTGLPGEDYIKGLNTDIEWHLPSSSDWSRMISSGARTVLPNLISFNALTNFTSRYFWSSDAVMHGMFNGGVFIHSTAGFTWATNIGLDNPWFSVRCVSTGASDAVTPTPSPTITYSGSGTFSSALIPTGSLNLPRFYAEGIQHSSGLIIQAGGRLASDDSLQTNLEVFNPNTQTWNLVNGMSTRRENQAMGELDDGTIIMAGGSNQAFGYTTPYTQTNLVDAFNALTNGISSLAPMSIARGATKGVKLNNGKFFVVGGASGGSLETVYASTEIYDPNTNSWSAGASMTYPRYFHTLTLLDDGRVLAVGGVSTTGATNTAEVYDPTKNTWSSAGTLSTTRTFHTAVKLLDGKVAVIGGWDGSTRRLTIEIYNPKTNTWAHRGSLPAGGALRAGTILLPNGKVLIAGGHNGTSYTSTVYLYDPTSATLSNLGSMASGRYAPIMGLLNNGKVIVNGYPGSGDTDLIDPGQ